MKRSVRAAGLVAAGGCALAMLGPAPAGVAASVPIDATCVDGHYFDGLDTRYASTYCSSAVTAAGYTAQVYSNKAATQAVAYEPVNAVFYHSGHALVTCSDPAGNNCTAGASLFPGTSSTDTAVTSLLGDPKYGTLQGPVQLCTDGVLLASDVTTSNCHDYTLTQYPYEQAMERFNLALFQSCDSAHDGVNGYSSLVTEATKVGTAIGFNKVIYQVGGPGSNQGGDAFARKFWADAKAGYDYRTSTVAAAAAAGGTTYNYAYYVIKQQPGAQTGLRPAAYNTPGA